MQELRAVIQGKVQGVWFRAWTRDAARETGVTGWVRNLPGGHVEVLAQGDEKSLDVFEGRLWDGPPLARVTEVRAKRAPCSAPLPKFSVRR